MIRLLLAFVFLIYLSSCSKEEQTEGDIEELRESYELLFEYEGAHQGYLRRSIIDYFIEIALGAEYGLNVPVTRKWNKVMTIYLDGYYTQIHREEMSRVIDELNEYFTDGFRIEQVDSPDEANFFAFFGSLQQFKSRYIIPHKIDQLVGYFYNEIDSDFNIVAGHMFVDTAQASSVQKHIIREELTQALGFNNDISVYQTSIFYDQWSDVTEYSFYDREIIRLLYHQDVRTGLGEREVRAVLSKILGVDQ